MAYIKDLQKLCKGCKSKRSTKEVFNRVNASMGEYCAGCATKKVRELQRMEGRGNG